MGNPIDKILTEWAYSVPNGMPDPENEYHLIKLDEAMTSMKLPRKFKVGLLKRLRKEEEDWWSKLSSDEQAQYIKNHPKSKKAQQAKEKENGKEPLDKKGVIELTKEQSQKEQAKNEYLSEIADLFIGASSEEKGHGRFRLSKEDVKQYQEHLNKTPEQILEEKETREKEMLEKIGKITDEDVDKVTEILREKLGNKAFNSLKARIKKKGDPPGEYAKGNKGNERFINVIQHYLQTGGISTITGETVPFSDSQLDHIISLDNGGTDGPHNWEWMESRFNQFKGKRTKQQVLNALHEKGIRTDDEWLLEASEDELKNFEKDASTTYWNTIFANEDEDCNPGIDSLSIEKIDNMIGDEIDALAKGWGLYVGERTPRFIARYGTRKTEIGGKMLPYSRGGDVQPDKNNPNSWGVRTDNMGLTWSEPKYKNDPDGYEKALADFEASRASGGAKITVGEVREALKIKISGLPTKSETEEIDTQMESILGQKMSMKSDVTSLKQKIKQSKAEV